MSWECHCEGAIEHFRDTGELKSYHGRRKYCPYCGRHKSEAVAEELTEDQVYRKAVPPVTQEAMRDAIGMFADYKIWKASTEKQIIDLQNYTELVHQYYKHAEERLAALSGISGGLFASVAELDEAVKLLQQKTDCDEEWNQIEGEGENLLQCVKCEKQCVKEIEPEEPEEDEEES